MVWKTLNSRGWERVLGSKSEKICHSSFLPSKLIVNVTLLYELSTYLKKHTTLLVPAMKQYSTTGAGGGDLKSHWHCLEAAQVNSVLRWVRIYVISPKGKSIASSKIRGVLLLPNTLSDMVVGLVFLPCFKTYLVT